MIICVKSRIRFHLRDVYKKANYFVRDGMHAMGANHGQICVSKKIQSEPQKEVYCKTRDDLKLLEIFSYTKKRNLQLAMPICFATCY